MRKTDIIICLLVSGLIVFAIQQLFTQLSIINGFYFAAKTFLMIGLGMAAAFYIIYLIAVKRIKK